MTQEPLIVQIDPECELVHALDEAAAKPLVLISNGVRYRVQRQKTPDENLWTEYDPERLRATLRDAAGTLTPEEGERLKEAIYRGREEGTRPNVRR